MPDFFKTGRIHNVEYDFVRKDGSVLPVLMSAVADNDPDGNFRRSLAVMFDNSAAKRAKAELLQKHRTDAVGQLVSGVAHDFNNLLSIIQGNLEFLREEPPESPMREVYLHDAYGAARRGATLTQQLLAFGRQVQLTPQKTNINAVMRGADGMLRRLMPANIEFETVTAGGLWSTMVDRAQLDTAILNIVNNARDAMPDGGLITIETANIQITEEYLDARKEDIAPGRYVMLAISDTGTGMTPEVMEKAFDPFYSTKTAGSGAGLGLSMVHGFVKQSEGMLQVFSEVTHGTTLKLYFPAAGAERGQDGASKSISEETPVASALANVLVVEDEADVRKVMVRQLTSRGLKVLEASSGDLAHGLLMTGFKPHVMVTDVVMPGKMQGPDLAKAARELVPDLRVIFVSGYLNEAAINVDGIHVDDVQLVKPVSRDQFVSTVLRLIAEDED
ncbi:MAG: ATP-binding protein [Paracoccaceae bacterium]